MSLKQFIFSKQFLKHFIISLILGNVLLWGSLFFVDIYTRHGEAIPVPNLNGITYNEAVKILDDLKMTCVITDSVYLSDKPKGMIVDQNPPADFHVKSGRLIFVTVNSMFPERVKMPDIVGVSLRQAQAVLETYGLKVGKCKYVPDIARNNVLKQSYKGKKISEGSIIEKGSRIDLVLGKGDPEEKADSLNKQTNEPDEENL
ncbi:MAG: hypothetical protein A2275_17270 [Bacteroidetes bacterium RIFOXYA12_FULL_35_11]|nr:MAG: hypothetical protein A2X01_16255 [Bacteroidetes bacterium GWF2_35_48]OFY73788.1 MAG: hypothetical protein A2275_17270 [Bacteroidetes bacterium RIFOXYA12_FULL_35_11]OFY94812.1 MAG: hypothetical protein A2491_14320 [Bacteroidetes bacterium RIFOXYC12_FULL_35_7]OFY97612.1 MAG: hypothetical protein A2309_00060 [Bacteroidetes bacterium RIFOXYB2_FULL_35_7]HBX53486.1 hypothetical protein [Bacteroidales bacterium]